MNRLQFASILAMIFIWLLSSGQQPVSSATHNQTQIDTLVRQAAIPQALELLKNWMNEDERSKNWADFHQHAIRYAEIQSARHQYQDVIRLIQENIRVLQTAGRGDSLDCAEMWLWNGVTYRRMDEYASALQCYRNAIHVYEALQVNSSKAAYAYKNAAQILMRYSDNKGAIKYLEAGLRCDSTQKHALSIYSQMTSAYLFMNNLPAARKQYELGSKISSVNKNYAASFYSVGAELALRDNKTDSAKELIEKALEIHLQLNGNDDNVLRDYTALADIAIRQNNARHAADYYRLAEDYARKHYTRKSREVGKMDIEIGQFHEKQGRSALALNYYQKALVQTFPDFNSDHPEDNPPLSSAWLESQALSAASAKAGILLQLAGKSTDSLALRQNAAHCFDLSFAIAAKLRHTYGDDVDKLAQSASLRSDYTLATKNLWKLWRITREESHLQHLFALIEQTKAQALADALQQQRALVLAGIPDSLLAKEAALRRMAADFTESLASAREMNDSLAISRDEIRLFQILNSTDSLIALFRKQYPQFRQFSDAELPADYASVKAALPDSATLLSWFDAGDRYFWITVRRQGIQAGEIRRDSAFDRELSAFLTLLTDANRQQADPSGFLQQCAAVSAKLLPAAILEQAKSLIVVPDGLLCYLPFDVLLTEHGPGASFASAPFLLRRCIVSYTWSAKMLTAPDDPLRQRAFVHFAPFASKGRGPFSPLASSLSDVPDHVSHDVLQDKNASSDRFLNKAPRCGVLHLSTHAEASAGLEPGIEFYDRTVLLPEIYSLRLHASLVALSACETGDGALANGEGVLSMARAFAYAGAQSLVASLWQVNDRSTANIFSAFYSNLARGQNKSAALRDAKLAILNSGAPDASKAPFFWAALTLNGSDGPVDLEQGGQPGIWVYSLLIAGLAALVFWRFRRKSST